MNSMSAETAAQVVMNEISDENDELINDSDSEQCDETAHNPFRTDSNHAVIKSALVSAEDSTDVENNGCRRWYRH